MIDKGSCFKEFKPVKTRTMKTKERHEKIKEGNLKEVFKRTEALKPYPFQAREMIC